MKTESRIETSESVRYNRLYKACMVAMGGAALLLADVGYGALTESKYTAPLTERTLLPGVGRVLNLGYEIAKWGAIHLA